MDTILDSIESGLKEIRVRLDIMEGKLDKIERDCSHMCSHIGFVETTYELVRTPLNYMKTRIEYMMGNSIPTLPEIKK